MMRSGSWAMVCWAWLAISFSIVHALTTPNIVFIMTDDQDLLLNSMDYMPLVQKYLTSKGATFPNFFVTTPVCCPSRASILRGQYAHNTQIIDLALPGGGGKRFHALGLENSTIATWLKDVGYRTALYGKYLNQYPCNNTWVPHGWDDWFALCTPNIYDYNNSTYNENGELKTLLEYQTDTVGNRTLKFIDESYNKRIPFFVHLSFIAPHTPARPAKKYKKLFKGVQLPRTASYNQSSTANMPSYIRTLPYFNESQKIQQEMHYRKRLQALQSVDEYVEKIVKKLESLHLLDKTYIVYTSDNGYHIGQHRLMHGKRTPYEEDIRVPFIIRGPGILPNISLPINAMNIDIAPTFAEMAGAKIPSFVDGVSFYKIIRNTDRIFRDAKNREHTFNSFRPFMLVEHWGPAEGQKINNTWQALRICNSTSDVIYTSWCTSHHEFYNISSDPYQLTNRHGYDFAQMHRYDSVMRQMFVCRGEDCNIHFQPLPRTEFLPTPLTPCFDGEKNSTLPTFHNLPHNKYVTPPDYTQELEEAEMLAKEREQETDEEVFLDFSYFSMVTIVLFVLVSVYACFTYRKKFSIHGYTLKEQSTSSDVSTEEKQLRKRQVV